MPIEPALQGPAHLDLDRGIAHKREECLLSHDHGDTLATACEGEMQGFVWCERCGSDEFVPAEDEDEDDDPDAAAR